MVFLETPGRPIPGEHLQDQRASAQRSTRAALARARSFRDMASENAMSASRERARTSMADEYVGIEPAPGD